MTNDDLSEEQKEFSAKVQVVLFAMWAILDAAKKCSFTVKVEGRMVTNIYFDLDKRDFTETELKEIRACVAKFELSLQEFGITPMCWAP